MTSFDVPESTLAESNFGSMNILNLSFGEINNSECKNSPSNKVPRSRDSDSEQDQDDPDLESLNAELEAVLMVPNTATCG